MDVKISDIKVVGRKRELNEEKIRDLANSFKLLGQLQPIVINQDYTLLAGLHRLEAAKLLGWETIKAEVISGSQLEDELIEIDENLIRNDLTVLEQAELLQRRNEILKEMGLRRSHGRYPTNSLSDRGLKTTEDIAKEVGLANSTLLRRIQIAQNLVPEVKEKIRNTPIADSTTQLLELAKLKPEEQIEVVKQLENKQTHDKISISDAYRKLKKEEEIRKARESIAAQVASSPVKPVISLQDWKSWLEEQPQCDLLITDPPYMTDVDNIDEFAKWLPVALSKVKNTGFAYVFIGAYPEELRAYLNVSNPTQILIWTYRNVLGVMPKDRYRLNYQAILFFRMPEAPNLNCPITNEQWAVHDVSQQGMLGGDRMYKWQKPDELAERLIRHSTKPGDLVLDCFAGSGTFLIAASKLGRVARGCDIDEEVIKIAEQRGCVRD